MFKRLTRLIEDNCLLAMAAGATLATGHYILGAIFLVVLILE